MMSCTAPHLLCARPLAELLRADVLHVNLCVSRRRSAPAVRLSVLTRETSGHSACTRAASYAPYSTTRRARQRLREREDLKGS